MLYLSHAHKPSATLQSLFLPDFLPSGPSLAVVLHSSIVFLALPAPFALRSRAHTAPLEEITTVQLNGRILAVQAVAAPPSSQQQPQQRTKRLLVLTDHHNPRLIVLTHAGQQHGDHAIRTEAALLLDEAARPPAELGLDLLVEPPALDNAVAADRPLTGQRYAATHTHSGLLRITPISHHDSSRSTKKGSSARRRSSHATATHMNVGPDDKADAELGKPHTARAFSVRLPHPTLISSNFLHPRTETDSSTLALLSLSSVPSRIPSLGPQCLPVLSFHAIDETLHELTPLPWGPPRRAPSSAVEPGAEGGSSARVSLPIGSRSMPGSYGGGGGGDGDDDDYTGMTSRSRAKSGGSRKAKPHSKAKGRGPSAMGTNLDSAALQKREEQWAKAPLTRAHVPLPYTDALGAHLVHALPASAGGGVIVFSETSILLVPPPSAQIPDADQQQQQPSENSEVNLGGGSAVGKRRKGSNVGSSGSKAAVDAPSSSTDNLLATSPTAPSSRANENGKRRRSSALPTTFSPPSSPIATRQSASRRSMHLLRISLPFPVQVSAATIVTESDGSSIVIADDDEQATPSARLGVLFACSSGNLELLEVKLARASAGQAIWRPIGLSVRHLGTTSQAAGPNALTYLGEGFVHVSSTTGDPVLYRIEADDPDQARTAAAAMATDNGEGQLITPPTSPSRAMMPPATSSPSFSDLGGGGLPSAGRLDEVHRWDNLGPIVDFTVDNGSGGDPASASSAQARIVTCSGSGPTSSLRIVNTGVAMEEVAQLDGRIGASRIWTLHAGRDAGRTSTMLAVAHPAGATTFLAFQPDGSTADLTAAVVGSSSTTAALVISSLQGMTAEGEGESDASTSTRFVVVDRARVALFALRTGQIERLGEWTPSPTGSETAAAAPRTAAAASTITNAAVNEHGQVLVCLRDHSLIYLKVDDGAAAFREVKRIALDNEVACIDVSPLVATRSASHCALATWGSMKAQILSLPDLKSVEQSTLTQERLSSLPRSILLHSFEEGDGATQTPGLSYLLIGLGDGTLSSYRLSLPDGDSYSDTVGVYDRKVVSLGTCALRLDKVETSAGLLVVSVAGERPTIVHSDAKRLSFSAIKYRGVRAAATLYTGAGQPALSAFAVAEGVRIASVGALQKLDIRTIPLGCEQPLAIAQHPAAKVFGVATWTFLPQASATSARADEARGGVRLLDQTDLVLLDEVRLQEFERPNCIQTVTLGASGRTYLLVGTGYVRPDASETTKGRLIGYEVVEASAGGTAGGGGKERRALELAFEEAVGGNVYAVVEVEGRFAAAVNSRVCVYELARNATAKGKDKFRAGKDDNDGLDALVQTGEWGSAFVACTLTTAESNRLVVGDALRSMNVLEVSTERGAVTEVARDCDPFWTTATEVVDVPSQTFIGADVGFNLYTTQRVPLGEAEKRRIRRARDAELESGQRASSANRGAAGGWAARSLDDGYAHVMQRQAVWHYGDMINKFRQGSPTSSLPSTNAHPIASPRLLFATAAGAIGVLSHLLPDVGTTLSQLERNIISIVESSSSFQPSWSSSSPSSYLGVVGGIPYQEYRTLRTDHRIQAPAGVVDGEVVRLFSDDRLGREMMRSVLEGPGGEHERVHETEAGQVERWCEEVGLLT